MGLCAKALHTSISFCCPLLTLPFNSSSCAICRPKSLNCDTDMPNACNTFPAFCTYCAEICCCPSLVEGRLAPPARCNSTAKSWSLNRRNPSVAAKQAAYLSYTPSSGVKRLGIRALSPNRLRIFGEATSRLPPRVAWRLRLTESAPAVVVMEGTCTVVAKTMM